MPAFAQGVVSSSTSQSTIQTSTALQTVTTAQSFTFTASHVVQPFGKYKVTPTGTIYAANGVDNVTITMTSGFPSFSGYQANATIQQFSSGCQKVVNEQSGANLVISYEGSSCGIAPVLKLTFSPLPNSLTSCSISWKAEAYSWCGDSGISYSGGVVTIVTPSATYDIDPVLQSTGGSICSAAPSCTVTMGGSVTSGNVLVIGVIGYQTLNTLSVTSLSGTQTTGGYTQQAVAGPQVFGCVTGFMFSWIYTATLTSSGSDTVTVNFGNSGASTNEGVYGYELSSVSGVIATASGAGTTGAGASQITTSTSPSYIANSILIATSIADLAACGTTVAAGSGFTRLQLSSGNTFTASESQTASGAGTTNFPFGITMGVTNYAEVGLVFDTEIPQQLNFVETVNAPPCGAIEIGAATTISTVSTLTITSTTSWTQSQVAFSGCINYGWSGATTFQQDTINPTQTEAITTISSYTTSSTISTTLTANFAVPSSGSSGSPPNYDWLILFPFIIIAIALAAKKR